MKRLFISSVVVASFLGLTTLSFAQWGKESTSTAKTTDKVSVPTTARVVAPAAAAAKAPKVRPTGRNVYQRNKAAKAAAKTAPQAVKQTVAQTYPQR